MPAWAGLWDHVSDVNGDGASGHSLQVDKDYVRYHLARLMKKRGGRTIGEKLTTLLADSTPSSTAAVAYSRVEGAAQLGDIGNGGLITIESVNIVNEAVDAADVTDLSKILEGGSEQEHQPTYPTDASGNGGGGQLGY